MGFCIIFYRLRCPMKEDSAEHLCWALYKKPPQLCSAKPDQSEVSSPEWELADKVGYGRLKSKFLA